MKSRNIIRYIHQRANLLNYARERELTDSGMHSIIYLGSSSFGPSSEGSKTLEIRDALGGGLDVSRTLDSLIEGGLVERMPRDDEDRRVVRIRLTKIGFELYKDIFKRF